VKRRLFRAFLWGGVAFIAFLILSRLALPFLLPVLANHILASRGLRLETRRVTLSLTRGTLEIQEPKISFLGEKEPLLKGDRIAVDLCMDRIRQGRWAVENLAIESLSLFLERNDQGRFPLFDSFSSEGPGKTREEKARSFVWPVELDAVEVQDVTLRYRDESLDPVVDTSFTFFLRGSHLGSNREETRLDLEITSPDTLSRLTLLCHGRFQEHEMDLHLSLEIQGFQGASLSSFLMDRGIRPVARSIDAHLRGSLTLAMEDGIDTFALEGEEISFEPEGWETSVMERFALTICKAQEKPLRLHGARLQGMDMRLTRLPAGEILLAGLAFGSKQASQAQEPSRKSERETVSWILEDLSIEDSQILFEDRSVSPETDTGIRIEKAVVKNLADMASQESGDTTLFLRGALPGMVESVFLEGQGSMDHQGKTLAATLDIQGICSEAMKPYLDSLGLEPLFQRGSLHCAIRGETREMEQGIALSMEATDLSLETEEESLFHLSRLLVRDLILPKDGHPWHLGEIALTGLRWPLSRDSSGAWNTLGLHIPIRAPDPTDRDLDSSYEEDTQDSKARISILVGRFSLEDVSITYTDEFLSPPLPSTAFEMAGLGEAFAWLPDPDHAPESPFRFSLRTRAEGLWEEVSLGGHAVLHPNRPGLQVEWIASGIHMDSLAPRLESLGIRPLMKRADLRLQCNMSLNLDGENLRGDLSLLDTSLVADGEEVLGLDRLEIQSFRKTPSAMGIQSIRMENPRFHASRTEDSAFIVAGILLDPESERSSAPPEDSREIVPGQPSFFLDHIEILQGKANWSDHAVSPRFQTVLEWNGKLTDFNPKDGSKPFQLDIEILAPGSLDRAALSAHGSVSETDKEGQFQLSLQGFQPETIQGYLPEGVKILSERLACDLCLEAGMKRFEDGGIAGKIYLKDVSLWDERKDKSLLRIERAGGTLNRWHQESGELDLEELLLQGLKTHVVLSMDNIEFMGIQLARSTQPANSEKNRGNEESAATDSSTRPLRFFSLHRFDLGLDEVWITNPEDPDSDPALLQDVRLLHRAPISLRQGEEEELSSVAFDLTGSFRPIFEQLTLSTSWDPVSSAGDMKIRLEGLQGETLLGLMPRRREDLSGDRLIDGVLTGEIKLMLRAEQAGVFPDTNRPFGLEAILKDFSLETGQGQIAASIDQLRVDVSEYRPDNQDLIVANVELWDPSLRIKKDSEGTEILGFLFKTPRPEERATEAMGDKTIEEEDVPEKDKVRMPLLSVERLQVSGMDIFYEDVSCTPPLTMPIKDITLEIDRFQRGGDRRIVPMDFSLYMDFEEIPLETRDDRRLLGRLWGMASSLVSRRRERVTRIFRPFCEGAMAKGTLVLDQPVRGHSRIRVDGLQLPAFRGMAGEAGTTVDGGILDAVIDLRFHSNGEMNTRADLVFTDLSISEPINGFISRTLMLPAPLDTVLFLLEDQSNVIRMPLRFSMGSRGWTFTKMATVASATLSRMIARSVATSPLRVVGSVTQMVPMDLGKKQPKEEVSEIFFLEGDTQWEEDSRRILRRVAKRLKRKDIFLVLTHEWSQSDMDLVAGRISPDLAICRSILSSMRQQRTDLMEERQDLSTRLEEALFTGDSKAAKELGTRISDIDEKLGRSGLALDNLCEHWGAQAERNLDRKKRQANIDLARDRLNLVYEDLRQRFPDRIQNPEQRIRITQPRPDYLSEQDRGKVLLLLRKR